MQAGRPRRPLLHQRKTAGRCRSSFAGLGAYGAIWTGDNFASFQDLARSIPVRAKLPVVGQSRLLAGCWASLLCKYEPPCLPAPAAGGPLCRSLWHPYL